VSALCGVPNHANIKGMIFFSYWNASLLTALCECIASRYDDTSFSFF